MPLQNRVAPDGALLAIAERGTMYGNRGGTFHQPATQSLTHRRWASRQWICCVLQFKDRRHVVWGRGYTGLFFGDEVSALAAGHRPCFECRRAEAKAFAAAMAHGLSLPDIPCSSEMDMRLHAERLDGRAKRLHRLPERDLPDGAMIVCGENFYAIKDGRPMQWRFCGYARTDGKISGEARLLTPPSIVAALRAGYAPRWHASAGAL